MCTDAGATRPRLWSTRSGMAAGALAEALVGAVRGALGAPPHAASAKGTADMTTVVNAAVQRRCGRRPNGPSRSSRLCLPPKIKRRWLHTCGVEASELSDARELLMGERFASDGRGRIRGIPSSLPGRRRWSGSQETQVNAPTTNSTSCSSSSSAYTLTRRRRADLSVTDASHGQRRRACALRCRICLHRAVIRESSPPRRIVRAGMGGR